MPLTSNRHPAAALVGRRLRAAAAALVLAVAGGSGPFVVPARAADGDDPAAAARQAERLSIGQSIYRTGLLPSGAALVGTGAAQTRLSGKGAACANCHRRSGHGTTEGRFAVRPITGPALLQADVVTLHSPRIKAQLGTHVRPPYTADLLGRAVRSGVDAAGKPLDSVMPRYALGDAEMEALSAYLFSLSAQNSPGVDDQEIHFATVIQPGVAADRQRAMLEVMQAFVNDKNANARSEPQRREAGTMRMYRAWRKWVLHVWTLTGPGDAWAAQLEDFYRQQPVFALVGGLGGASWQPIHEFAERLQIPSVFPQVDLPVLAGDSLYNFYFSRGVQLEAEVLARHLRAEAGAAKVVLQVYRRGEVASAAAAALRAALAASGPGQAAEVHDQVLEGAADPAFWRSLAATRADAVVLWLGAGDVEGLAAAGLSAPVYASLNLLGGKRPKAAAGAVESLRLIQLGDLPPRRETRLLRHKLWLHNKGIAVSDESVQVNTLFLMTVVSDVIGHLADNFSRDLFVERVEHVVGQTLTPSLYPQVSLGPGQRFAAKGGSIVQWADEPKAVPKSLSGWIVP